MMLFAHVAQNATLSNQANNIAGFHTGQALGVSSRLCDDQCVQPAQLSVLTLMIPCNTESLLLIFTLLNPAD